MATEVEAHVTGRVWKVEVEIGNTVPQNHTLAIIESMKMEMPVEAPTAGTVVEIRAREGEPIEEGDVLVVLE